MDAISDLRCLDVSTAAGIRDALPAESVVEEMAARAAALADPTRMALALALRDRGEICVCDLSWILGRPEKLISHHLLKMRAAGVVAARREGRLVMCRLTDAGVRLLGG
jgi:DNA-binding transcriptional ArsR family regulator